MRSLAGGRTDVRMSELALWRTTLCGLSPGHILWPPLGDCRLVRRNPGLYPGPHIDDAPRLTATEALDAFCIDCTVTSLLGCWERGRSNTHSAGRSRMRRLLDVRQHPKPPRSCFFDVTGRGDYPPPLRLFPSSTRSIQPLRGLACFWHNVQFQRGGRLLRDPCCTSDSLKATVR